MPQKQLPVLLPIVILEKARIDAILNLSSSDLDTFREIADAYQNADSNLQTLITNLTTDLAQLRADFDAHFP
jgi:chromosome condensin MukBEF complex kleisin-like MukF subunit